MAGSAQIIRGDARSLPLDDASVDLVVTSPPYWSLRSYRDGGEHYEGQIGAEPTPAEYVDSLIACTREWVRVLKPDGSIWVNLGDKYSADASGPPGKSASVSQTQQDRLVQLGRRRVTHSVPQKSLVGLPWRYALRCIDDLGLILRAEVIWSKPNGLPESVTDRVRRSHETWFHLTRSPRYFSAVDTIREQHEHHRRDSWDRRPPAVNGVRITGNVDARVGNNPLGKLPGSVWEIPTEPLKVPAELGIDHFAAFPTEWPRRIIQGWSPSGICTACDEGRRPVAQRQATGAVSTAARGGGNSRENGHADFSHINRSAWQEGVTYTLTGEACACPDTCAPTRPSVVLDPFGGTGTTALVAKALGRLGVTVDMSGDYTRLARWRTTDPGEIAKAMRVEKPPKEADGQADLFGYLEAV